MILYDSLDHAHLFLDSGTGLLKLLIPLAESISLFILTLSAQISLEQSH